MELYTRENVIIAASIVIAVVVWLALGEFTDLGNPVRYGALIAIGVVLPMLLTNGYSS